MLLLLSSSMSMPMPMPMLWSLAVDELIHEGVVAVVFVFEKEEDDGEERGRVSAAKKCDDEGTKGMVGSIACDSFLLLLVGQKRREPVRGVVMPGPLGISSQQVAQRRKITKKEGYKNVDR